MAEKTEQMVFRNAFQGYNKEDVNDYIKKLSKDFSKLEEEYKSTIEKKDAEIRKLAEKVNTSDNSKNKKNPSTAALEAQIAKLNLTIETQKKEIKDLKEELKKSNNLENLSDEELSKKIGDIFLVANRSADTLRAEAKAEADRITADAIKESDQLIADAKARAEGLKKSAEQEVRVKFEVIKQNINTLTKNFISDYEKGVSVLKTTIDTSIAENSKQLEQSILELKEVSLPTVDDTNN